MTDSLTGPQLVKTEQALEPKINRQLPLNNQAEKTFDPVILLILDGWGIGPKTAGNAIELAKTPIMDSLWLKYPHTQLGASGEYVGLPKGVDGNSETGHMNIGAGRVVRQNLPRVSQAIEAGTFFSNETLLSSLEHVKKTGGKLHLLGLVGPGLVHSSVEHLKALLKLAHDQGISQVEVHAFTDGRDSPVKIGLPTLQSLEIYMEDLGVGRVASIMGRFYGMDRDRNWDRTQRAYEALTEGKGELTDDWQVALQRSYDRKVTDEFVEPIIVKRADGSLPTIDDGDTAIFFNFRVDRPRQLSWAFVLNDFEYRDLSGGSCGKALTESELTGASLKTFNRAKKYQDLFFVTMTDYDSDLVVPTVFPREDISVNLGKFLSESGVRQLRLTETEKEKMVTYYIDGKSETYLAGEHVLIFPSKKVASYQDAPEMTAKEIADALVTEITNHSFDAAVVNICNGDMVGHTGNLQAGIEACEVVDLQVGKIVEAVLKTKATLIITADHGNIEEMIDNETGEIDTAHSTYPVPCIFVAQKLENQAIELEPGILADLAPTMISLLGLAKPEEMTGRALIKVE